MDVGPGRLPGGGRRQRAESRLPLVQAQLASGSPLQARGWSHLCPQRSPRHLPHTSSPHASLTPSSLLLQSQIGPWGFGPNTYILHIYWTCTCSHTQPFTIPCTLWMEAHGSPSLTTATQQAWTCTPPHRPWLIELPPSHFLSTCQAEGGVGGHRREVSVSLEPWTDMPCLGQITEAASFQEPEPAVLMPYRMPEGGTAGLSAHSSKKSG